MSNERDGELIGKAKAGDEQALVSLLHGWRDRLVRTVRFRLDPQLRARIDASDVVQEANAEIVRRIGEYEERDGLPMFLWARFLTLQKLRQLRRYHLGSRRRDARREAAVPEPAIDTSHVAHELTDDGTLPLQNVEKAEARQRVTEALERLDPMERQVLVMRHYEGLSNQDVALVLGIQPAAASKRYLRALASLRGLF